MRVVVLTAAGASDVRVDVLLMMPVLVVMLVTAGARRTVPAVALLLVVMFAAVLMCVNVCVFMLTSDYMFTLLRAIRCLLHNAQPPDSIIWSLTLRWCHVRVGCITPS